MFAFRRDDALDARNPFSKAQGSGQAPFDETRGGGYLGGPIVKSRWHFFGSYEGLRNATTNVITSPLVPVSDRESPEEGSRDQYFIRSEYQLPRSSQLGRRYRYDISSTIGGGIGGLNPRERGYDQKNKYGDGVLTLTSIVSPRHGQRSTRALRHVVDVLDRGRLRRSEGRQHQPPLDQPGQGQQHAAGMGLGARSSSSTRCRTRSAATT